MSFVRNAAWLGGAQGLNLLFTLATRVLLARLLGAASFGAFGAALGAATLLSRALSFGSATASQVFASRPGRDRGTLIGTSLALASAVAVVATGIGFLLLGWIQATLLANHPGSGATLALLLAFLPVVIISMNLGVMLIPFRQVKAYSVLQLVGGSAFIVPCALLSLALPPIQAAAWAQVTLWLTVLIATTILLRDDLKTLRVDWDLAREMVAFGWRAWPNVCLSIGLASCAVLFGAPFLSPVELSLFVLALNIVEGVFSPHASVGQLMLSKAAADTQDAYGKTALLVRLSWVAFLGVGALMAATGWWLIPTVFGREFTTAYAVTLALLVGGAAHAIVRLLGNVFAGVGQPARTTRTLSAEMAAFLVLLVGLGQHGLWGVVAASSGSAVVGVVVGLDQFRRLSNLSWTDLLFSKRSDWSTLRPRPESQTDLPAAA